MTSGKTWILGIQHVLAMYAGAVVVPILVGGALKLSAVQMAYLISADLFTCGIATLLQVLGTRWLGVGLPVVLGCTFTAVGPLISIGLTDNLPTAFGAILVAGLVVVVLAPVFGRLLALFPTVVTGSVVTVIGLSLIPVAMNDAAGGQGSPDFGQPVNLLLALFTLLVILLLNRWARGFLRAISVLIGLVLGTLAAAVFGKVSLQSVAQANWMGLIHPLYFGRPQFHLAAIVTMCVVCVVSMVESTGVYFALSRITGRELKDADVVRGLRAEGVAIVLGDCSTLSHTRPFLKMSAWSP
ncbi:hypothetical protein GCM10025857_30700 [Alicyclobacillus contaminans]|nr:hypothetical protein GCM10025857_30700 [Alicyclobacillus contaminans]